MSYLVYWVINIWNLHNYNENSYTPVNHKGVKITKNEINY